MAVYNIHGQRIDTGGTGTGSVFINVVDDFGATGDGTTNDAPALQRALTSAKDTGGIIYFPTGTYKLEEAILFYSNQTLFFENGAVLLQGAEINSLLRAYCESTWTGTNGTHDCVIYGATFDGGSYTTDNTLLATVHAKNIIIENCTFKNAYGSWHDLEINSSYNVKVINCDFEGSRKNSITGEMIQIDSAASSTGYPWDGVNYDRTTSKFIEIVGCVFHDNNDYAPAIGNHTDAYNAYIRIHDCVFNTLGGTRGCIYLTASVNNVDIYDNTFYNCVTCIGTSGATYYIHDNRFVGATTAISGSASVAHANMINGTYTA